MTNFRTRGSRACLFYVTAKRTGPFGGSGIYGGLSKSPWQQKATFEKFTVERKSYLGAVRSLKKR